MEERPKCAKCQRGDVLRGEIWSEPPRGQAETKEPICSCSSCNQLDQLKRLPVRFFLRLGLLYFRGINLQKGLKSFFRRKRVK